jgi:hypothetical protein
MEISQQRRDPADLLLGREYPPPVKQRAAIAAGCFGEEKNLLLLLGIKPQILSCPPHSVVITATTLSPLCIWTVGKVIKLTFQKEGKHVSVHINCILKC